MVASHAVAATPVAVDIPAGPMDTALLEYGRQTDVSIVFGRDAVAPIPSRGLSGVWAPEDALQRLLEGACLSAEWIRPRLVAIKPGCMNPTTAAGGDAAERGGQRPEAPRTVTAQPVEEVMVYALSTTGTRLDSGGVQLPANLHTISRPDIENSGQRTLSHLLRYVPAVSGNSTSTLVTNGGDGSASVTLRGLPASNTLVLLNGRRINPDAFAGEAVDLNALPLALIERIEILKDGASAVYGSDAVAGVVNIHTRKVLSGLNAEAYAGRAGQGGLETEQVSLVYGHNAGDVRWHAGASWYHQGALYSRERSLSASSDERARGGTDKRSSAIAPSWITLASGPVTLSGNNVAARTPADYRPVTGEDRFEYRDHTSLILPARQASLFFEGSWRWSDSVRVYLESLATSHETTNQLAPTPLFTAFEREPLTIPASQPFNPFGVDIVDLRRRITELGPRKQNNRTRSHRVVAGLSGDIGRTTWDLALLHARTRAREIFSGAADTARITEALAPGCFSPCVPLDLFGPEGSIDPLMANWISSTARSHGESRLRSVSLNLASELLNLPSGTVDVATGMEYREETLDSQPDALLEAGRLLGSANFAATSGRRTIWELWGETRIPLIHDLPLARRLDAYIAGRHSVYNDFDRQTNPRVVLHYVPRQGIGLRASISRSFRAPTLQQLFGGQAYSFEQLNDPCSLAANVGLLPGCLRQSDPALDQFQTEKGGNPRLAPERSRTLSLALEWNQAWRGVRIDGSVDFYRIRQRDVVDTQAQFVLNRNAAGLGFSDRVRRDASGNVQQIIATPINIGDRDVEGIDIANRLTWTTPATGLFELAVQATHIARFADRVAPGLPMTDLAGTFQDSAAGGLGALPDWKASIALRWQKGFWRAQADTFMVSDVRETVPLSLYRRKMEHWAVHNAQFSYRGPATRGFRLSLGVNNILDESPPWSAAAFNDSYDSRTYDITGRFLYIRLEGSLFEN